MLALAVDLETGFLKNFDGAEMIDAGSLGMVSR